MLRRRRVTGCVRWVCHLAGPLLVGLFRRTPYLQGRKVLTVVLLSRLSRRATAAHGHTERTRDKKSYILSAAVFSSTKTCGRGWRSGSPSNLRRFRRSSLDSPVQEMVIMNQFPSCIWPTPDSPLMSMSMHFLRSSQERSDSQPGTLLKLFSTEASTAVFSISAMIQQNQPDSNRPF